MPVAAAGLPPLRQPVLQCRLLLGRDRPVVQLDVAVHVPGGGGNDLGSSGMQGTRGRRARSGQHVAAAAAAAVWRLCTSQSAWRPMRAIKGVLSAITVRPRAQASREQEEGFCCRAEQPPKGSALVQMTASFLQTRSKGTAATTHQAACGKHYCSSFVCLRGRPWRHGGPEAARSIVRHLPGPGMCWQPAGAAPPLCAPASASDVHGSLLLQS